MIFYTILIPFRGETGLLNRLLSTIPDREDMEIVIIDNNPRENALSPGYFSGRKNVFVFYSDPVRGAGHARNVGLRQARGKWVIFADADDFFHLNAFPVFDSYKDADADLIYFCADSCYSESGKPANRGKYISQLVERYLSGRISLDSFKFKYITAPNKMIRTRLLCENRIEYEEIVSGDDILFSIRTAYFAQKIRVDRSIVYCITVSDKGDSITQIGAKDLRYLESDYTAMIRANLFLKSVGKSVYQNPIFRFLWRSRRFGLKETFRFIRIARENGISVLIGWRRFYKICKWIK